MVLDIYNLKRLHSALATSIKYNYSSRGHYIVSRNQQTMYWNSPLMSLTRSRATFLGYRFLVSLDIGSAVAEPSRAIRWCWERLLGGRTVESISQVAGPLRAPPPRWPDRRERLPGGRTDGRERLPGGWTVESRSPVVRLQGRYIIIFISM